MMRYQMQEGCRVINAVKLYKLMRVGLTNVKLARKVAGSGVSLRL
jgi:hypothetical protein